MLTNLDPCNYSQKFRENGKQAESDQFPSLLPAIQPFNEDGDLKLFINHSSLFEILLL